MFELFVCDDDVAITDYLKFFILKHFQDKFSVVTMNRCHELIGMVEIRERVPDVLIMDINLKDGNGISTVKTLQTLHPKLKVIYLTGLIGYATEIFETNPSYFLTKPIHEDKLKLALEKVAVELQKEIGDHVVIKSSGSEVILQRKDIVWVESQGRKLIIHTSDGKTYEVYEKMDALQERLGGSFVRSHKSFLVNMRYITERTQKEFYLSTGCVIPISKTNLNNAKIKFVSYLGEENDSAFV